VALVLACPSQSAMVEVSTPAVSRSMAAVCRSVCGVMFLEAKGRTVGGGDRKVFGQQIGDRVAAEVTAEAGGEQRVARCCAAFGDPLAQEPCGGFGQWGAALLAALPGAAQVRPCAEFGVGAGKRGEFGDPQSGLGRDQKDQVVTPAEEAGAVGGGKQRVGLRVGEVADVRGDMPGGGDGQHPLDE